MPIEMSELRELVGSSDYNYDPATWICEVARDGGESRTSGLYCGRDALWTVRDNLVMDLNLSDRGQCICEGCFNELPPFPVGSRGRVEGGRKPKREEKRITRRLPK